MWYLPIFKQGTRFATQCTNNCFSLHRDKFSLPYQETWYRLKKRFPSPQGRNIKLKRRAKKSINWLTKQTKIRVDTQSPSINYRRWTYFQLISQTPKVLTLLNTFSQPRVSTLLTKWAISQNFRMWSRSNPRYELSSLISRVLLRLSATPIQAASSLLSTMT